MRSLQLSLRHQWDFMNQEAVVAWEDSSLRDLQWWSDMGELTPEVSLAVPLPDLFLYTDASDQGWGAVLGDQRVSGLWSLEESSLSINHRELMAILLAVRSFLHMIKDRAVALY